jgi:hypothetical protein
MSKPPAKYRPETGDHDIPALETHHFQWIFDAAIEHFAEKIRSCELSLVRHRAFLDAPACERFHGSKSRDELIEHENRYLQQYRAIHAFCCQARDRCVQGEAKQFAESFREWLRRP